MNWITPDWPVNPAIHAAVTLRNGGVSQGCFHSFNLADHVGDCPDHVNKNRQTLCSELNLPAKPLWLEQVHGCRVIKADQKQSDYRADASFTDQKNTVCAVLTADCLPILLASFDGNKIAAIHAGWRGLLAGIISKTVNELGTMQCMAWLGPAISQNGFEVGEEVRSRFIHKFSKFDKAFKVATQGKYMADIYQLARIELNSIGIQKIYGGDFCTMTDESRFFSYRRDGQTGRMASLIWRE